MAPSVTDGAKGKTNSSKGRCPDQRSEEKQLEIFYRLLPEKWLKPRPESGRDCLICAELAVNSRALMPASMLSSFIAFDVSLLQVPI